jgi:DNA helicase-2/ATP-dependent DNA helicase PcrA
MIGNAIRNRLNQIAQQNQRQWQAQSFYFEDELESGPAAQGFALLTLLVDPEDRTALRYWLAVDSANCRSAPYARLAAPCAPTGQSPRTALTMMVAGQLTLPYCAPLVARFNLLNQRLAAVMMMDIQQLIDGLFPGGNDDVTGVRQLALGIAPNVNTPQELLTELRTAIIQPQLPGSNDHFIRIMSLHKSKGLTARLVVISGCINGILPSSPDEDETPQQQMRKMQEQRRLFYVGLTRSTETLVLNSSVRMPFAAAVQMRMLITQRAGAMAILQASPFLGELGATAPAPILGATWRAQLAF